MGSVDAANFNSTAIPGVCKATNQTTLNLFKELQRQLNRVLSTYGAKLIGVDGEIGPGTVGAMTVAFPAGTWNCTSIAGGADAWMPETKLLADSKGAPAQVSSPRPPKPPSIIDPITNKEKPQPTSDSIMDFFKNMSTTEMLVGAGAVVGVAFLLMKPKRGWMAGPGASATSNPSRRRRRNPGAFGGHAYISPPDARNRPVLVRRRRGGK
jgi:hypothetical protein